jgi:hypothetical protein
MDKSDVKTIDELKLSSLIVNGYIWSSKNLSFS